MQHEHYLFVTGRLAEPSLREVLERLAPAAGIGWSIQVMKITVAALMTPKWIARRIAAPPEATRIMVPGYCAGDLGPIAQATGLPVERGPRDLRQLPEYFGQRGDRSDYGDYDIEIVAEINLAGRLTREELLSAAAQLEADGADLIDLGCEPRQTWNGIGDAVRALRDRGHRVSVDSYNMAEIEPAVVAGAELVLSANKTNRRQLSQLGCEAVIVPDEPGSLDGIDETIAVFEAAGTPYRLDPILSPIGFGFAESLGRYLEARRRWPLAAMLMGVGNVTELTDADSAAINVLLLGFCQEQNIKSVLTTQEINWARTSVRECHLARQLMHHALGHRTLPKHIEPGLVMLRDPKVFEHGTAALDRLARDVTDHSYRLFAEEGRLHAVSAGMHIVGQDPFDLFERMEAAAPRPIEASHAFYLGYEMAKAVTALTLGKNYRQDEALDWGMLTVRELTRLERRALRRRAEDGCDEPPETVVEPTA